MKDSLGLLTLLKEVLGEEALKGVQKDEISIDSIPAWDSLNHLRIIMEMEEKYNLSLTPEDFQNLTSLNLIEDFVESNST
jgi:acyl carrier protein